MKWIDGFDKCKCAVGAIDEVAISSIGKIGWMIGEMRWIKRMRSKKVEQIKMAKGMENHDKLDIFGKDLIILA